jgi:hypothetical protein
MTMSAEEWLRLKYGDPPEQIPEEVLEDQRKKAIRLLKAKRALAEGNLRGWRAQLRRSHGPNPLIEASIHEARDELHELDRQIHDLEHPEKEG